MGRALVVGCGYVGSALGLDLVERGWDVWGLKRRPEGIPDGVRSIAGDVARTETLRGGLPGSLDVVVYAVSADRRTEEAYRLAYPDGLQNVLQVLEEEEKLPGRLLFVSSTAVYEGVGGAWVDETLPSEPSGFRGRILLEAEELARTPARWRPSGNGAGAGGAGVVVRLGGIYGPGRTSLVEKVRRGEGRCPPGGPFFTNRIHRDDAAGILSHLARADAPDPVYLGVDRDPAPYCEVLRWLAERMRAPFPEEGDDGSLNRRRRASKRCRSDRIVESGYVFRYPSFRDGYGDILEARGISA